MVLSMYSIRANVFPGYYHVVLYHILYYYLSVFRGMGIPVIIFQIILWDSPSDFSFLFS